MSRSIEQSSSPGRHRGTRASPQAVRPRRRHWYVTSRRPALRPVGRGARAESARSDLSRRRHGGRSQRWHGKYAGAAQADRCC